MNNPKKIITHTAVSQKWHTTEDVDEWHQKRWPGFTSKKFKNRKGMPYHVGYHFVIEWDGKVVQTRGYYEEGAHCIGQNRDSIGVCFMGNGDLHTPSTRQKRSWVSLYNRLHKEIPQITAYDIYPHRKWANKTCHGRILPDDYYQRLVPADPMDKDALKQKIVYLQQLINRLQALILQRRMK